MKKAHTSIDPDMVKEVTIGQDAAKKTIENVADDVVIQT